MIRPLDFASETLLAQLNVLGKRLERVQREISSGYRVNTASDAPDQVADILALRASLAANEQVRTNLQRARSEVETADGALARVVQVLDRALALAAAGSGTQPSENRYTIAQEVRGLEEQLVALSRTMYGDRYLFSGDLDIQPCYGMGEDGTVERLATAEATRKVQHPSGVSFSIAKTAQEIFDHRDAEDNPTAKNVFAAVTALRVALEADDQEAVEAVIGKLRAASAHVNAQTGFYGAVHNRIKAALDDAGRMDLRLKTALSERRDTDVVASVMELQQVQLSQAAAMQMRAMTPARSLFDYLK